MKIDRVKIYDLEESIIASKYPMATDLSLCNSNITPKTISLFSSPRGSGHDNALHGVLVAFDLTFTNKAFVELQRYHFIEFVSSQSTNIFKYIIWLYVDNNLLYILFIKSTISNSLILFDIRN